MNADVDTDAAHIMAEIRTFRRQMDELAALTEGSAKQDPDAGCSPEPGGQLESRENVLQAAREVVEGTTTFRQITFRDLPDIRIRLELRPDGPAGRRGPRMAPQGHRGMVSGNGRKGSPQGPLQQHTRQQVAQPEGGGRPTSPWASGTAYAPTRTAGYGPSTSPRTTSGTDALGTLGSWQQ